MYLICWCSLSFSSPTHRHTRTRYSLLIMQCPTSNSTVIFKQEEFINDLAMQIFLASALTTCLFFLAQMDRRSCYVFNWTTGFKVLDEIGHCVSFHRLATVEKESVSLEFLFFFWVILVFEALCGKLVENHKIEKWWWGGWNQSIKIIIIILFNATTNSEGRLCV